AYKKILKLCPHDSQALIRIAGLYVQLGDLVNAKRYYRIKASQLFDAGEHDQGIDTYKEICKLDPECPASRFELARALEKSGKLEEAAQAYLTCGEIFISQGKTAEAVSAAEGVFRIRPSDKEVVRSFFGFLERINLTERGIEYLKSLFM